jgi:hypothetical protein
MLAHGAVDALRTPVETVRTGASTSLPLIVIRR